MCDLDPRAQIAIDKYLRKRLITIFTIVGITNLVALFVGFFAIYRAAEAAAREAVVQTVTESESVRKAHIEALSEALAALKDISELKGQAHSAERDVVTATARINGLQELLSKTEEDERLQILKQIQTLNQGDKSVLQQIAELSQSVHTHSGKLGALEAWKNDKIDKVVTDVDTVTASVVRTPTKSGLTVRFTTGSVLRLSSSGTKNNIESFGNDGPQYNTYLYGRVQEVK